MPEEEPDQVTEDVPEEVPDEVADKLPEKAPDKAPVKRKKFVWGTMEKLKIMMLAGALMGVISLFLPWFSVYLFHTHFIYAGLDFYFKSHSIPPTYPEIGYYAFMPWIVFAASAIVVVIVLVTLFIPNRKANLIATSLGPVAMFAVFLYLLYPKSLMTISASVYVLIVEYRLVEHLGYGVYVALIGGFVVLLAGLGIIMTDLKIQEEAEKEEFSIESYNEGQPPPLEEAENEGASTENKVE